LSFLQAAELATTSCPLADQPSQRGVHQEFRFAARSARALDCNAPMNSIA
jgi:hypothetical protein